MRLAPAPILAACLLAAAGGLTGCTSRTDASAEESATVSDARSDTASTPSGEWRSLFDGSTLAGWRGFRQDSAPAGWTVRDGAITRVGGGGDLVTADQFGSFELELEWRVEPGGNSGVLYRVTEDADQSYHTGPEMQVLDDAGHADGRSRLTAAGAVYGLYPAPEGVVKPANEWNRARLVVNGSHVEHWLNGTRMAGYELGSPDWERRVAESKFAAWKGYGRAARGHIALQDHGDLVQYRGIRIRELP
ncbi:MAG TPA: DUF1080 domain-containing protein [Gemmatimonadales bacterium]